MGDAKMKRITEEINKILMGNFDFKPRFSPPRKEYHPNKLLSQVDDQEDRGDDHEKERNVDEAEGNLDEEDQQKEKPQDRGNKDDERQRDEDADRKEDAPPKQGEEEESTTKTDERTTNEEQKSGDDGGSSELQVETPPRKELGASGRQEDQEDEIMTTEGIRGSGGDTSKESDKRNDSVALREDPKTKRGPVLFQVANAREDDSREDDSLMKKIKMKCVPVSDETVSDDVGKEENEKKNKAVEEIKHKATDGNSKERVQEADNQTENPETNEVSTVSQDEELDNREEDEMKIEEGRKDGDDLKRKEQVSGEVEHSTTHEEPERKEDEDVKNEVSPKQDEDAERKEEKSNIQSAPSRDDKSKEEGSRSNIGKPPKIKVKPEEKDEYYSEEYKRHGGIDYKDSQSHRHKETDKEQHKHHGREEGGHDDRQEHEHAFGKHNHGSKLEGVDKDNKDDFQQKHLLEKQKQLQSERHLKKGNYEQQHLASSKEQIGLKDGEENKYKRHGDALSGSHLGASSLDKIPVIEIFDGVPGVDYSKHSDYSEQAPRVPSTTHVTPFTTPNPSQLLVESNRHELPIKGHFSSAPNPYQQRYELPSSTPLESLPSKTLNHFSISSTFDTITTPQEHLLTTTPTHQLIIQTSNSLTIPNHDNLFTTTPNQRPLVLTQDLLHVTSTPNDQLLVTTPSHIPFISTTHEVPNVSPQEGRVAIRHQPAETTELEHEKISTTTASSKIIDQLDKYKSDQHNDLLKSQEDADRQLKKQINEVNQELKGLNAVNTLPPETSATDKRNKQQLDWQDYQQQLYYPKPSPKPQGLPPFITVEVEKRRPPILVEDVDYPELVDTRGHRAVNDEYAEPIVPTGRHRYYV